MSIDHGVDVFAWLITVAIGIVCGVALSRAAFAVPDVDLKQAKIMIGVWTGLLIPFAAGPWFWKLTGASMPWRLFGVYRLSAILAISCCVPCLLFAVWKRVQIGRTSQNP